MGKSCKNLIVAAVWGSLWGDLVTSQLFLRFYGSCSCLVEKLGGQIPGMGLPDSNSEILFPSLGLSWLKPLLAWVAKQEGVWQSFPATLLFWLANSYWSYIVTILFVICRAKYMLCNLVLSMSPLLTWRDLKGIEASRGLWNNMLHLPFYALLYLSHFPQWQ